MTTKLTEEWVQQVLDGRFGDVELVTLEESGTRRHRVVRLFIDHPAGVGHDLLAAVSTAVGAAFDEAGVPDGSYTLEVSSPGIERPLTKPAHFVAQLGNKVYVKTKEPVEGHKVWQGVLEETDESGFTVSEAGRRARIEYGNVTKAHLVFDFN
jgi:ribosome maturation factor RimP